MTDFIKIAHRGSSGSCPENTRAAFEKAVDARVDMVELDCQLCKDGHVVVIHDTRLERTARVRGHVKGTTLQQLKRLDVGAWFKKSFRGETIPTLEEAMEVIAGRAAVNVEIKQVPDGPLGIELKILFILSAFDYLERSVISSLDYWALRRVREMAPDVNIGIIYGTAVKDNPFKVAKELNAYSLHVQKELVTPELLDKARALDLKVFVWTVNEVAQMEKFLSLGVDGLVSDYPERFWKVKRNKRR